MDRTTNADIGAATADIGNAVDVGIGGIGLFLEQSRRRHDLARLAIAALRDIFGDPGGLHRMKLTVSGCETLASGDVLAGYACHGDRAGAHRNAVDVNRAGAALRDAATEFRAGQSDLVAQRP